MGLMIETILELMMHIVAFTIILVPSYIVLHRRHKKRLDKIFKDHEVS